MSETYVVRVELPGAKGAPHTLRDVQWPEDLAGAQHGEPPPTLPTSGHRHASLLVQLVRRRPCWSQQQLQGNKVVADLIYYPAILVLNVQRHPVMTRHNKCYWPHCALHAHEAGHAANLNH